MGKARREVGFWTAVRKTTIGQLLTFEIAGGALIGVAASWWLVTSTTRADRIRFVGDYLTLTPALLGVVFAALAMVVALMSEDYLRLLRESSGDGVVGFLRPFIFVIGLQVGALLSAVGFRAFAPLMPESAASWAFGVVTVLFVVSTLEVVALARSVVMHGMGRARLQRVADIETERGRRRTTG